MRAGFLDNSLDLEFVDDVTGALGDHTLDHRFQFHHLVLIESIQKKFEFLFGKVKGQVQTGGFEKSARNASDCCGWADTRHGREACTAPPLATLLPVQTIPSGQARATGHLRAIRK